MLTPKHLQRLADQVEANVDQGLVLPRPEPGTPAPIQEFAERCTTSLDHSNKLGILSSDELGDLRSSIPLLNGLKLQQVEAFVSVINALYQGVDIRKENANYLIKFFVTSEFYVSATVMRRFLEDLKDIGTRLNDKLGEGRISEEEYQAILGNPIAFDRMVESLDAGSSKSAPKKKEIE